MSRIKMLFGIFLILIMAFGTAVSASFANAEIPTRKTRAYLDVAPHLVGVGQAMTVNEWVYPSPASLTFSYANETFFKDLTTTFTRPDGTKDTFKASDGSGGLPPGQSEFNGAIWFYYTPNQAGTWTVQFSMPQQAIGAGNDSVYYAAATSEIVTFTVQKDPVNAGVLNGYPWVPLPTGYWTRPINSDNREWSQISGDWLQAGYNNALGTGYNPYSKAPSTSHILWKNQVSAGGIIGGPWGSYSEAAGGGSPAVIMLGNVYYNMPGSVFDCVDLRTGQLLYEKPGTITLGQYLLSAEGSVSYAGGTIGVSEYLANAPTPHLWELGSSQWKLYNPLNGALLRTITGVLGPFDRTPYVFEGDPVIYCIRQQGWNTD
jgi:hypothetical protein